jgi:hypothetical protein
MSRLKQDSSIETIRFRQAVYINWTKNVLIPDPCGQEPGYEFILACFIEQLMNSHNSRAETVRGYVKANNTLFELRQLKIPGDISDKENLCSKIIHARECEEDIAKQNAVPLQKKCLQQWLVEQCLAKKIRLTQLFLIGFVSYESQDYASPNMLNAIKQKSTSKSTHLARG